MAGRKEPRTTKRPASQDYCYQCMGAVEFRLVDGAYVPFNMDGSDHACEEKR